MAQNETPHPPTHADPTPACDDACEARPAETSSGAAKDAASNTSSDLSENTSEGDSGGRLAALDHAHVWHPFTPMRQWCEKPPLIIERGEGPYLFDTEGKRYLDGVSSLWCNVHGHAVPHIDQAIRNQLDKIAHTTLLGLASPPSIELAARLVELTTQKLFAPHAENKTAPPTLASELPPAEACPPKLNKVFYSDAGATALEVAFKMAVGHWFHNGQPRKTRFIGLQGAYHGDTAGSMSIGYSDLFHRAFKSMVFPVDWFPAPDACRPPADFNRAHGNIKTTKPPTSFHPKTPEESFGEGFERGFGGTSGVASGGASGGGGGSGGGPGTSVPGSVPPKTWPSEDPALAEALTDHCIARLAELLEKQADQTAAIVIEPVMQGAAGMVCQPPGFMRRVAELAKRYDVLLIADEVAVGFGRTGKMFACEHDRVSPDILCLAKGLTAGYLPLAVTMTTDAVYDAFTGSPDEKKTLYHGHTYTGNPLACAAALAGLDLFEQPTHGSPDLITHIQQSAQLIHDKLSPLRTYPHVRDIRQRGIMVGIELTSPPPGNSPGSSPENSPKNFLERPPETSPPSLRAMKVPDFQPLAARRTPPPLRRPQSPSTSPANSATPSATPSATKASSSAPWATSSYSCPSPPPPRMCWRG